MLARKRKFVWTDARLSENFPVGVEFVQGAFEGCECGFCDISATSKVACIKKSTESFNYFIVHKSTNSSNIDL